MKIYVLVILSQSEVFTHINFKFTYRVLIYINPFYGSEIFK